ncbi:MAG: ABC transporter permease, partial [Novosphingobium sp.]|nr:ABC transporter permease [Novosphingobium sp.]
MTIGAHYEIEEREDGAARLRLSGPYLVATIGTVDEDLRDLSYALAEVDLSGVTEIDTVGAWLARSIAERHGAQIVGASDRAQRLLDAVGASANNAAIIPPRKPFWERVPLAVGLRMGEYWNGIKAVLGFLGQIVLAVGSLIRHPRRLPGKAVVRQLELVGVDSLPIIGLMSFLIGIVIAQQGSVQLAQFGAETLTVNLVGRITLRELGVLMTAIMVAGRSGSAFAAQIGTMK